MTKAQMQMEIDRLIVALNMASRCYAIEKARQICRRAVVEHDLRLVADR